MMQTQERPRFRQDLVAEAIEEQGARFVDVADPDSGHMFRFYEVEYALACAMDGERDVAGIVQWAQEELGLTPSPTEVQTVISTLADLRFIETVAAAAEAKVAKAAATTPAATPAPVGAEAHEAELAAGVVVGAAPQAARPVADLELGQAGTPAIAAKPEVVAAPDLALGASGASAAQPAPKPPVADIALGASGAAGAAARPAKPAADVSLDLADHLAVKPADVKEAVRASKVMTAVDVPKDLQDQLAPKAPEPVVAKVPEPVVAKVPEPMVAKVPEPVAKVPEPAAKAPEPVPAKAEPVAAKAEPVAKPAEKAAAKPAVELPRPVAADKEPVAPAPDGGVSPLLVVLLIVALISAGAFLVWKFVINAPEPAAPPTTQVQPPPTPPTPTSVTSKIALETAAPVDIKAPTAGTIETIEAADRAVVAGDAIATLAGGKPLAAQVEKLTKEIEKLQPAIEAAEKTLSDAQQIENNQARVAKAQAAVDKLKKPLAKKQTELTKAQADLDKLTIKSVNDGALVPVAQPGQAVAVDEVIARIAPPTTVVATFKVPVGTKIAPDGTLSVTAGDKTVVCTVSDAQAETVKVACPADAGLAEGTDVTFTLPN